MIEGYIRGNRVTWDDGSSEWKLSDGRPARLAALTCPQCQRSVLPGAPDPCIGYIPYASGACCGHGVHLGYINWPGVPVDNHWWRCAYIKDPETSLTGKM